MIDREALRRDMELHREAIERRAEELADNHEAIMEGTRVALERARQAEPVINSQPVITKAAGGAGLPDADWVEVTAIALARTRDDLRDEFHAAVEQAQAPLRENIARLEGQLATLMNPAWREADEQKARNPRTSAAAAQIGQVTGSDHKTREGEARGQRGSIGTPMTIDGTELERGRELFRDCYNPAVAIQAARRSGALVFEGNQFQRDKQLLIFCYGRAVERRKARKTVDALDAELTKRDQDLAALRVEFEAEARELRQLLDGAVARILHLQAIEAALCEPREGPLH